MDFLDVMQTYFRGERISGLFYILPAGLLAIGLAATALGSSRDGFGWGMAAPLALVGLLLTGAGATLGVRTPAQVAELEQGYRDDPAAMVARELPRMETVNANWPKLMATWTALVVIGLALRFGLKADWAHGLGPALMLLGAMGFMIDGFAERRAQPYTRALEQLAAEHGVGG